MKELLQVLLKVNQNIESSIKKKLGKLSFETFIHPEIELYIKYPQSKNFK